MIDDPSPPPATTDAVALPPLPPLREVIAHHHLAARKSLGQHFLLDENITDRIVRLADLTAATTVVEIGPGPGGLTRALLRSPARRIVAVERDARCLAALADLVDRFPGRLDLVAGDALAFDAIAASEAPRAIVANLPYGIATALLVGWLDRLAAFGSLTLMFQREVAERMVARPRTKAYGRLSVMCQWCAEVSLVYRLPASAFVPPPKVASAVVRLTPRDRPQTPRWSTMETVCAAAFGQRRKMLRTSLWATGIEPGLLLDRAGLDATLRAEDLSVADFIGLGSALEALGGVPARDRSLDL